MNSTPDKSEIFDVVDEEDNVIGQATRQEVHAKKLLHRVSNIFIFNSKGEMLVQKRSQTKDEYPGRFTSSVSGHLDAGETYEEAAHREMQEEIGFTAPLTFIEKFQGGNHNSFEHTILFKAIADDVPICDPVEVEEAIFFSPKELAQFMQDEPNQFTPPFRMLFLWYYEKYLIKST